jgi:DNA sulfur modification protein DndC
MNKKIQNIIDEIVDQYAFSDPKPIPWIIGFSGGKDSTVLLTLVWEALLKIKDSLPAPFQLRRPVYVVCNDTMVENPVITEYVYEVLDKIQKAAREQNLPIFIRKTLPKLEDSFWVNVIGRGYPVPNNAFRWCTERLKIRPTSTFILDQVNEIGEAIILLGTRISESSLRARSIKRHEIKGRRLTKHTTQANTFVYTPIKDLLLEEVWYIINALPSPWGADNSKLFQIYANASADDYECPTVVTNKDHPSCGQSRFGCWVCTVVKEDKSMVSLVKNGLGWLEPLLNFRNELVTERNILENRSKYRRNGQVAVNDLGVYNDIYRAKLLRGLLETQREIQTKFKKPYVELITNQELIAVQVIWYRDGIFDFKVGEIYSSIFGKNIDLDTNKDRHDKEKAILKDVCSEDLENYELICELLELQKSKTLLMNNYGLQNDLENRIEFFIKSKK